MVSMLEEQPITTLEVKLLEPMLHRLELTQQHTAFVKLAMLEATLSLLIGFMLTEVSVLKHRLELLLKE